MDTNIFKYIALIKTVELGSFSKAATVLHHSQSSVSKMISDLENEWDVHLLQRGKYGVTPTAVGEQFIPYARTIINDYEKLKAFVNELKGVETGSIKIGSFSSVSINWLPNIFEEFHKDFPNIDYEILLGDYNEIETWIKEGRIDCGFISRSQLSSDFEFVLLKQDEYKVVLPRHHPLAKQEVINIHALADEEFLLLENGGKTEVSALLEKYKVYPKIKFSTWEDFAIMAMTEKGLGVSILPELILSRVPYDIEIRSLSIPYYRDIGIAFKSRRNLTVATEKFLDYLRYREKNL